MTPADPIAESCSCCGCTDTPLADGTALCECCFESLAESQADRRALTGLDRYYGDDYYGSDDGC